MPGSGDVAFAVDGVAARWGDVWDAARFQGGWDALEREVREGVALRDHGLPVDRSRRRAEEDAFRRSRRLLSAEEVEAWLADRDVTVRAWRDHIARCVLRAEHDPIGEAEATSSEVAATGWCSGAFSRFALALAEARVSPDLSPPSKPELAALIEQRRLDWTRFVWDRVAFSTDAAAREALLCVREDGLTLAEVAARARARYEHGTGFLEDQPSALRSPLLGAAAGDTIAAHDGDRTTWVVTVVERRPASSDDPAVVERANRSHRAEHLAGLLEARVRWHEPR